ncbi:GvpL/GvpF family gas vesicle protein [Streptomyces sp. NPDC060194]|uniref:GvpL/GvpF family gas vesicle protein n=1 Tax=Streptomyces sp. NPDC060194 TaxID=3347069 RepID=UPI0036500C8E
MTESRARRPGAAPTGPRTVCVFAVRRTQEPPLPPGLAGHPDGGTLRITPVGALWAVVQEVPAPPEDGREWCVRTHHAVVTGFAADGEVVPLPAGTVFASAEEAAAELAADGPKFDAVLRRLAGRAEWAVRVSFADPPEPAPEDAAGPPPCGRAYLAQVIGRRQERTRRRARAAAAAELVDREVGALAEAAVRRDPHGPGTAGPDRTQVLNAAYLLARERGAELAERVQLLCAEAEFAESEVEIEVTGPWVAYSFADEAAPPTAGPPAADGTPPVEALIA